MRQEPVPDPYIAVAFSPARRFVHCIHVGFYGRFSPLERNFNFSEENVRSSKSCTKKDRFFQQNECYAYKRSLNDRNQTKINVKWWNLCFLGLLNLLPES